MRSRLRTLGRGLLWILASLLCVTVFAFLASLPVIFAGTVPAALFASVAILASFTWLMWVALRTRVEVPPLVWLVLAVNLGFNLITTGLEVAAFKAFNAISSEAAQILAIQIPKVAAPGVMANSLIVIQGALAATTALAFLLRRRGPAFRTRRGRVTALTVVSVLSIVLVIATWGTAITLYGLAMEFGHNVTAKQGETVTLIDSVASVTVPPGWSAEVHRPVAPPPSWLLVPRSYVTTEAWAVRVFMKPESRLSSEPVAATSEAAWISVFANQTELRKYMSEQSKTAVRKQYQWPADATRRTPDAAYIYTRRTSGGDWRTTVGGYYDDPKAPMALWVMIPHSTAATPSAQVIAESLKSFTVRP